MTPTAAPNKPPVVWRLFNKLNNPLMKRLLRSPLHGVVSRMFLLLTFTGRKSGRVYSTPVQYAQDGDVLYIVTSEGYTWWKNLRGGADVQVHLRGRAIPGWAETSADPQAVHGWLQKVYPGMSAEQRARFAPGRVAITIRLRGGQEAAR